jgi:hypothetical protein
LYLGRGQAQQVEASEGEGEKGRSGVKVEEGKLTERKRWGRREDSMQGVLV